MSDPHPDPDPVQRLAEAALLHVPFDGWSDATFRAACRDTGIDPVLARLHCPRGALDLALAFHRAGDAAMVDRLRATDLSALRFRDRIATAIRFRLEAVPDREALRRATTLFALPQHAPEGARALWATADLIWTTLGDTSDDLNWYSKRATLAAVHAATVLFWLGDDSPGQQATWDFLDRRLADVMALEEVKARMRQNPLTRPFMAGQDWLAARIRRPGRFPDLPGGMTQK